MATTTELARLPLGSGLLGRARSTRSDHRTSRMEYVNNTLGKDSVDNRPPDSSNNGSSHLKPDGEWP